MSRFLFALASSTALVGTGFAQSADDAPRVEAPVLVTTPGPNRSADELIGNATRLDREDLVESLASTLGDTLDSQPGVSSTFFGAGASRPILRGLGAERVQVLTNGIGVIDVSAASPDHQVTADAIDAEAIEILRGPAALTYGGQAIGGVVNVIDGLIAEEIPDQVIGADLFTAYNSVNEGTELAANTRLTTGNIVVTLSGSLRDFDDYDIPDFAESSLLRAAEEAEEEEEHGEEDEDHDEDGHGEEEEVRGTAENSFVETATLAGGISHVGENSFFGIAIRQQTSEYGLPGHGHEEGHGHDEEEEEHGDEEHGEEEGEEEESPFIDLEQTRVDLRGGVDIDGGVITGLLGSVAFVDYEHIEFEAPGETGTVFETEGMEGRFELDHSIAGFDGAIGIQFTDVEFSAVGEEAFISPTDSELYGIFLYETREWDSGFGVEGGLRFETVERDNVDAGIVDFDLVSGSVGAHRHLDGGWFAGVQVSYTERAPTETELFAFGPHLATDQFEIGDPTHDKETGINLEGTVRYTTDSFSAGINVFGTEFSDFTFFTPGVLIEDGEAVTEEDGLPVFVSVQEDATFVGGELYADLTVDGLLGAEWEFGGSLDLVEADLDGDGNVPFIPPLTVNLGASAEWGAFEIGADVTVADEQDDPGAGQFETDGYTLVNLRAEFDLSDVGLGADGTEIFVEARNVTDEEARLATSVLKDLIPVPGQNIRVGLRATF